MLNKQKAICPVCGSQLEKTSEITYRCPYCDNEFDNEDLGLGNREVASSGTVVAQPFSTTTTAKDGSQIYEENIMGCCMIMARDAANTYGGDGSGLLVSDEGFIITNTHVVWDDENDDVMECFYVQIGDKIVEAKLVEVYRPKYGIDLALLKLKTPLIKSKKLKCGDSAKVKHGETVYAIGNSLGQGLCITCGIISDIDRRVGEMSCFMADVPTNHGNSGGPLFNSQGEVIAICVAGIDQAEGMNYFIPINLIRDKIKKYVKI